MNKETIEIPKEKLIKLLAQIKEQKLMIKLLSDKLDNIKKESLETKKCIKIIPMAEVLERMNLEELGEDKKPKKKRKETPEERLIRKGNEAKEIQELINYNGENTEITIDSDQEIFRRLDSIEESFKRIN